MARSMAKGYGGWRVYNKDTGQIIARNLSYADALALVEADDTPAP